MTKVVNLNRFRKKKQREEKAKQADINRIRHGRTQAEKDGERVERERAARLIEGKRLEPGPDEAPVLSEAPFTTTILTTARLRLEPFDHSHGEQLHEMNSDPDVMRFITGRPQTLDETRESIVRVRKRWAEWGYSWWSIFELATGRIIGAGCIQHLGGDAANPLEVGYRLRKDKWRQGFASEAARAMATFAFETLDATLLTAICDPDNEASSNVMKRLGMSYRGVERWHDTDCAVYGVTRSDWLAGR